MRNFKHTNNQSQTLSFFLLMKCACIVVPLHEGEEGASLTCNSFFWQSWDLTGALTWPPFHSDLGNESEKQPNVRRGSGQRHLLGKENNFKSKPTWHSQLMSIGGAKLLPINRILSGDQCLFFFLPMLTYCSINKNTVQVITTFNFSHVMFQPYFHPSIF